MSAKISDFRHISNSRTLQFSQAHDLTYNDLTTLFTSADKNLTSNFAIVRIRNIILLAQNYNFVNLCHKSFSLFRKK